MRIGFDAKRAFFNQSGLGNYSRDLIRLYSAAYPKSTCYLFSPKKVEAPNFVAPNTCHVHFPNRWFAQKFPSAWRSSWIKKDLAALNIDLYHGLSNELPKGIEKTNIASVVSIHDVIFKKFPHWYPAVDRNIYDKKTAIACAGADKIIAVSHQTKQDIIEFYDVNESKIQVVYQGCHQVYRNQVPDSVKREIAKKYSLPSQFILSVGTIESRKNLKSILQAIKISGINVPLVVVGKKTPYIDELKSFISENGIQHVHFFHTVPFQDLPGIYQMAHLVVYPSLYEGFGIPILEAITSGVPVLTNIEGCLPEAGGPNQFYAHVNDIEEMSIVLKDALENEDRRAMAIQSGIKHVAQFTDEKLSKAIAHVYDLALISKKNKNGNTTR